MEHQLIRKTCIAAIIISLIAILCLALVFGVNSAAAEEGGYDEFERTFIQTAEELGLMDSDLVFSRSLIYDIDGNALGYVFDYDADGVPGYAVAILGENGVKVTEICPNSENPYVRTEGIPVYTGEFGYWDKAGENFISLTSGAVLSKAELLQACEIRYCAIGDELSSGGRVVNYESKQVSEFSLARTIPTYYYEVTSNACVPIAAGNIVAYFDRYCAQLIPNYTPGRGLGLRYDYIDVQGAEINAMMAQLCVDMGTNVEGNGNTVAEFKSGLNTYCARAGYSLSYESCMSGNSLDYNKAKQSIQTDRNPVILFVQKLEISTINESGNSDTYDTLYGPSNHAMSAFGYYEVTYSLSGGGSETGRFLQVATGIAKKREAYLNIDNNLQMTDAYTVNIA